jgi:fatty-acyl-CoA synthase
MGSEGNFIWEAFEQPGEDRAQLLCWEGGYRSITRNQWRRGTERSAAGLRALGVQPGARVAAVLTNSSAACNAILGAWLAGATLLSLPTMRRGMAPEEYMRQLGDLCTSTAAQVLLLEDRFLSLLDPETFDTPIASFESLDSDAKVALEPLAGDAPAFVQYSSGSTGEPKGVLLSIGAIARHERLLVEHLSLSADHRGVIWLPLSHDMGLFGGLLLSWVTGGFLALSTPERFLRHPETWFDDAADFNASLSAAPSFGLALATRRARTRPPKGCCPMQTLVLGGERIELTTIEAAIATLGPYGVTGAALTPAYGLAEATLAVTMKRLHELPRSVSIDREASYRGELSIVARQSPNSTAIVSCGTPLPGASVRLDEPPMGRIRFRSASIAEGYIDDPEHTAASFRSGEFLTEDLGFTHEGDLYVLGRTDDVIVFAGRNIHARDIEREIERHDGVRLGCSALIDARTDGQPQLVLVAEPTSAESSLRGLADEVAQIAFATAGLHVSECVFVVPGRLPKTPSGKVQRHRCRALLDGAGESRAVLERLEL